VAGVNALDVVMLITCSVSGSVIKGFHCFLECYSMRDSKFVKYFLIFSLVIVRNVKQALNICR